MFFGARMLGGMTDQGWEGRRVWRAALMRNLRRLLESNIRGVVCDEQPEPKLEYGGAARG